MSEEKKTESKKTINDSPLAWLLPLMLLGLLLTLGYWSCAGP